MTDEKKPGDRVGFEPSLTCALVYPDAKPRTEQQRGSPVECRAQIRALLRYR